MPRLAGINGKRGGRGLLRVKRLGGGGGGGLREELGGGKGEKGGREKGGEGGQMENHGSK